MRVRVRVRVRVHGRERKRKEKKKNPEGRKEGRKEGGKETLSKFVIAILPRSKRLLISWLESPSSVILEPRKIKSVSVSIFSPSICCEVMRPNVMILIF